jgi:hypothetical protein
MGCASANDPSMYQVFSITSWPVAERVCVWDSMGQLYCQHFHLPASQPCCGLLLVSLWPPGKVQSFPWLVFAVSCLPVVLLGLDSTHFVIVFCGFSIFAQWN